MRSDIVVENRYTETLLAPKKAHCRKEYVKSPYIAASAFVGCFWSSFGGFSRIVLFTAVAFSANDFSCGGSFGFSTVWSEGGIYSRSQIPLSRGMFPTGGGQANVFLEIQPPRRDLWEISARGGFLGGNRIRADALLEI